MSDYAWWLNLHSQEAWHDEGRIAGSRAGLLALRKAIGRALAEGKAVVLVYASDGEGYTLTVELAEPTDEPTYLSWEHQQAVGP